MSDFVSDRRFEEVLTEAPRFVICIDYGTTYTGAAWVLTKGSTPTLADVRVVQTWGEANAPKVPSLYTYTANDGALWGYDIGDDAYVIRWSKLELEAPTRHDSLIRLRRTIGEAQQLAHGSRNITQYQIPRHLTKSPSDVVTAYLIEVAGAVRLDIERERDVRIQDYPIDLIITHPAEWDHQARNLTFKAVCEAFRHVFPEALEGDGVVRLVTEPEACAQFTMRCAQDKKLSRLQKGQCFIVVDAGGGTVDLVSYLVEQVKPTFKVRQFTDVSGARYGATRIDDAFLYGFLPERLQEYYPRLRNKSGMPGTEQHGQGAHTVVSQKLQVLLNRFQTTKHEFAGRPPRGQPDPGARISLEGTGLLDPGVDSIDRMGIEDGELKISCTDLERMFQYSVDGTINLIKQQLTLVDGRRGRVNTVFLSGGLSRSDYLYKRLNDLAQKWKFNLIRGEDSWSAVAQGGVLMGLGVECIPPTPSTRCPFHIGVVLAERWTQYSHNKNQKYQDSFDDVLRAKENVKWLVAKDDLITADEGIEVSQPIIKKLSGNGNRAGVLTLVLSETEGPIEPPTQMNRDNDYTRRTVDLDYDLTNVQLSTVSNPETNSRYLQAEMHLEISINKRGAEVVLLVGKTRDALGQTSLSGTRLAFTSIPFQPVA